MAAPLCYSDLVMAVRARKRQTSKAAPKRRAKQKVFEPVIEQTEPIPELYVDGFMGLMVKDGVVKINLFSDVQDVEGDRHVRHIVGRLIMPASVLVGFNTTLTEVVKDLEPAGGLGGPTRKKKG